MAERKHQKTAGIFLYLRLELDDLWGPFQPKPFYHSLRIWSTVQEACLPLTQFYNYKCTGWPLFTGIWLFPALFYLSLFPRLCFLLCLWKRSDHSAWWDASKGQIRWLLFLQHFLYESIKGCRKTFKWKYIYIGHKIPLLEGSRSGPLTSVQITLEWLVFCFSSDWWYGQNLCF